MGLIADNLARISSSLQDGTKLLAVSKTHPADKVLQAYEWGQRDFGENKVQDLLEKSQALVNLHDIRWHFIGHLQSNKINQLLKVPHLAAIHSVDSVELLNKLIKKEATQKIGVFLQINTSGEEQKSGFALTSDLAELNEAINLLQSASSFYLQGLMTIGKIRTQDFEKDARSSFSALRELKQKLDKSHSLKLELSMGMSQDYEIAQEYGTTWVRIGTDIFGQRE